MKLFKTLLANRYPVFLVTLLIKMGSLYSAHHVTTIVNTINHLSLKEKIGLCLTPLVIPIVATTLTYRTPHYKSGLENKITELDTLNQTWLSNEKTNKDNMESIYIETIITSGASEKFPLIRKNAEIVKDLIEWRKEIKEPSLEEDNFKKALEDLSDHHLAGALFLNESCLIKAIRQSKKDTLDCLNCNRKSDIKNRLSYIYSCKNSKIRFPLYSLSMVGSLLPLLYIVYKVYKRPLTQLHP